MQQFLAQHEPARSRQLSSQVAVQTPDESLAYPHLLGERCTPIARAGGGSRMGADL